jgi:hypothetical protein
MQNPTFALRRKLHMRQSVGLGRIGDWEPCAVRR